MKGIYAIVNKVNGKQYVGSSKDIQNRFVRHKYDLKNNKHINLHLQNAWNKYHEDSFDFEILEKLDEQTSEKDLGNEEQKYIDSYDFGKLYNMSAIVGRPALRSSFFNEDGSKKEICPNIGDKINDFTVIGEIYSKNRIYYIKCQCKCKEIKECYAYCLIVENSPKNCGCDKTHMESYKHGATSGGEETVEFKAWKRIIEMCYYPQYKAFNRYGGKGVTVCDEWRNNFQKFLDDMGERPSDKHILGRKDTSGNYTSENCFWTTLKKQNNNRKDTIYIEYNNIKKPLREWAEEIGINPVTLWDRIRAKWTVERALTEGVYLGKNQFSKSTAENA